MQRDKKPGGMQRDNAPTIANAKRKAVDDYNALEPTNLPYFGDVNLRQTGQTISDAVRMGAKGASYGFSDNVGAGIDVASSYLGNMLGTREPISYEDALAQQKSQDMAAETRLETGSPGSSTFFQMAPALAQPSLAAETLPAKAPWLLKAAGAGAEGAAQGALSGAGEGHTGQQMVEDMLWGGAFGTGGRVAGDAGAGAIERSARGKPTWKTDQDLFDAADKAGRKTIADKTTQQRAKQLEELHMARDRGKEGLSELQKDWGARSGKQEIPRDQRLELSRIANKSGGGMKGAVNAAGDFLSSWKMAPLSFAFNGIPTGVGAGLKTAASILPDPARIGPLAEKIRTLDPKGMSPEAIQARETLSRILTQAGMAGARTNAGG